MKRPFPHAEPQNIVNQTENKTSKEKEHIMNSHWEGDCWRTWFLFVSLLYSKCLSKKKIKSNNLSSQINCVKLKSTGNAFVNKSFPPLSRASSLCRLFGHRFSLASHRLHCIALQGGFLAMQRERKWRSYCNQLLYCSALISSKALSIVWMRILWSWA